MSLANGAVEIRRISKIDPDAGDVLSLDFLSGDAGSSRRFGILALNRNGKVEDLCGLKGRIDCAKEIERNGRKILSILMP